AITGSVLVSTDERDALAHAWIAVSVIGGDREGEHAHVRISPESTFFVVDNTARTAAPGKKLRRGGISVELRDTGERVKIGVCGKIRPGQEIEVTRGVPRPGLFAAHTLRGAILSAGIEVGGGAAQVRARPPEDGTLVELARHESVPLSRLAAMINKPSNNFLA